MASIQSSKPIISLIEWIPKDVELNNKEIDEIHSLKLDSQ